MKNRYQYTILCYTSNPKVCLGSGCVDVVTVILKENNKKEAIKKALKLSDRDKAEIVGIKVL